MVSVDDERGTAPSVADERAAFRASGDRLAEMLAALAPEWTRQAALEYGAHRERLLGALRRLLDLPDLSGPRVWVVRDLPREGVDEVFPRTLADAYEATPWHPSAWWRLQEALMPRLGDDALAAPEASGQGAGTESDDAGAAGGQPPETPVPPAVTPPGPVPPAASRGRGRPPQPKHALPWHVERFHEARSALGRRPKQEEFLRGCRLSKISRQPPTPERIRRYVGRADSKAIDRGNFHVNLKGWGLANWDAFAAYAERPRTVRR